MPRFAHTFYLIIIAVLATLLYIEHSNQSDTAQTDERQLAFSDEVQASLHDLSQRVAELQTEVANLHNSNQQEQSSYQIQYHSEDEMSPDQPQVAPVVSTRGLPSDLSQHQLSRRIENESTDPDWSYQQEDLIRELFISDDYLQSLQLNDVRCRSTLCELQIQETDSQQPINTGRLHQQLTIGTESMSNDRLISIQQEDIQYLYIFRN